MAHSLEANGEAYLAAVAAAAAYSNGARSENSYEQHALSTNPYSQSSHLYALPSSSNTSSETTMKMEKDLIYSHPLFPLLAVIFDKCELATCCPRDSGNSSYVCSLSSFNEDINEFTKQLRKEHSCYSSNGELDNLVHELCDNFCQRYISLLKGKMPTDIVLDDQDTIFSKSDDEQSQDGSKSSDDFEDIKPERSLSRCSPTPTHRHIVSHIQQQHSSSSSTSDRTTPKPSPNNNNIVSHYGDNISEADKSSENLESSICSGDGEEENDDLIKRRQKKRGIFPKSATNIMRAWLFQHLSKLNKVGIRIITPEYNDFLTNNPYNPDAFFDASRQYVYQTGLYDEMTTSYPYASYCSSMHQNSLLTTHPHSSLSMTHPPLRSYTTNPNTLSNVASLHTSGLDESLK
ncbi:unnamed protein product [Didymodactylos carnosus]|uniref:MEIS N-terminal domain-containing protein n=1 Tax=Didymodactylos carnosus TaxID=1234261 RepID=A0A8S2EAC4_9BILA|nr:unnamed protein product [Didymodactylos carnosus]CAF3857006.1 unnamed protein product [Didymodactylos carnosus]